MWGALIGAGASLLGGAMSSRSASKAADQQESLAREGLAAQREMYDIGRGDLAPYRQTGEAANARLSYLLGLEGGGNPAVTQAQQAYDDAQARYNSLASARKPFDYANNLPDGHLGIKDIGGGAYEWRPNPGTWQGAEGNPRLSAGEIALYVNGGGGQAGLGAAQSDVSSALAALNAAKTQPWTPGADYGSLMEKFTGQDLYDDPGYKFRLDEGMKARENSRAAQGMQLSGPAMKDFERFGQGLGSQEFGAARNRWIGDQDQTVNYLTAPTQRGMQAASQGASAAQNFGANQSNTLQDIGNARSAGTVAGGNAWQSGINSAYNAYQDSNQTNRLNALLRGGYNSADYSGGMKYLPKSY